ncbi:MAG TPA: hypothetical protein ENH82_11485 [bacterium]|nr:hypothetical protein [bacterium]
MEIIVNGEKISSEIYEREIQNVRNNNRDASDKEIKKQAQQNIIDQAIIRQKANKQFANISEKTLNEEFGKLIARYGGKEQFYQRFNLSEQDDGGIKKELEQNIRITRLLEYLTKDVHEPSLEEISTYYKENKKAYVKPEELHAAHIVKQINAADSLSTFKEMKEIRKELLDGSDFAETADKHSGCDDAGGDLGFFPRGKMVEEFDVIAFSMEVGEISPVFQTQFGYHIATVYEKKPEEQKTLEECREEIKETLNYNLKNDCVGKWVDELKKDMEIEIKG